MRRLSPPPNGASRRPKMSSSSCSSWLERRQKDASSSLCLCLSLRDAARGPCGCSFDERCESWMKSNPEQRERRRYHCPRFLSFFFLNWWVNTKLLFLAPAFLHPDVRRARPFLRLPAAYFQACGPNDPRTLLQTTLTFGDLDPRRASVMRHHFPSGLSK